MKKASIALFILASLFVLSACGQNTAKSTLSETNAADSKNDVPAGMVDSVLVNPIVVYEETLADLTANQGGNIGTGSEQREITKEGVEFHAGEGENPFLPFAKGLNEAADVKDGNQAFCIRFKPSAKDFGFMLSATNKLGITIGEDSTPLVFSIEHEYMAPMEGTLKIEPENWYRALIAINPAGEMSGVIWKDSEESTNAYFYLDNSQFHDENDKNQSWQILIGFLGEATFTISDYQYYTFSDIVRAG